MRELENNCELWRIERHLGEGGGWELKDCELWSLVLGFPFIVGLNVGWSGSVWFGLTSFCITKSKPNRTKIFSKYSNWFNWFFFLGSVLSVNFFSVFSVYLFFLLTPSRSLNFFMGSLCKKARSCSWIWNPLGISHWNLCT
jgi:hypothetical protein